MLKPDAAKKRALYLVYMKCVYSYTKQNTDNFFAPDFSNGLKWFVLVKAGMDSCKNYLSK